MESAQRSEHKLDQARAGHTHGPALLLNARRGSSLDRQNIETCCRPFLGSGDGGCVKLQEPNQGVEGKRHSEHQEADRTDTAKSAIRTPNRFLDLEFLGPPSPLTSQPEHMSAESCDVLILGGGMVGLSIAHQLLERSITSNITILDKEPELGLHSSGRNSGVIHAGLYYKPGSIKATVCVEGGRRLRSWVEERVAHQPLRQSDRATPC